MADDFDRIVGALDRFDESRLLAVCYFCVGAVSPVVHKWGARETTAAFDEIVDIFGVGDEKILNENYLAKLESLPESEQDDSHKPAYYVMRAIGVASYCVGASSDRTRLDRTKSACVSVFNLARDFDFECKDDCDAAVVTACCTLELDAVVKLLSGSMDDSQARRLARNHSNALAKAFDDALPGVVRNHNW
ncbi:hypothetical protein [Lacipirellula parvula]|nr:hypothetical protein [Lacipirellula parvula]